MVQASAVRRARDGGGGHRKAHGGMGTAGGEPGSTGSLRDDLVVIAVSGVQAFISESRTTSDLSAGSAIVERLSVRAARECVRLGARLVFPSALRQAVGAADSVAGAADHLAGTDGQSGGLGVAVVPNRIVALAPRGSGSSVAAAAADAVRRAWDELVRKVMGRPVATPGMPSVQWVSVPATAGGYGEQWAAAQRLLMARKRLRSFGTLEQADVELCSLSPRWSAEPGRPSGVPAHEQDRLAAANWVKRRYRYIGGAGEGTGPGAVPRGFPSTSAIASAPFRYLVLAAVDDPAVCGAVSALYGAARVLDKSREQPLPALEAGSGATAVERWLAGSAGRWVYPDSWQEDVLAREFPVVDAGERAKVVAEGARAVRALHRAMADQGVAPPGSHLAIVAQDLDGMGRFLGGEVAGSRQRFLVTEGWHREVSAQLSTLARDTCEKLGGEEFFGVPVYAGGDDLLAFFPAAHALAAAAACRSAVRPDTLPTASTAVLFFHHRSPLQRAVREAQHLLEAAKEDVEGKNGLAVGYLRRSGVREQSVQAWARTAGVGGPVKDFTEFLSGGSSVSSGDGGTSRGLSLRLVQDCLRDEAELVSLPRDLFSAEIRRLVVRHGGTPAQADALVRLAVAESGGGAAGRPGSERRRPRLAQPVKVAAFLRQECAGGMP
ncbi:CRISPR-associated protein [Streptomyces cyanogenus]|uniref:CRISPR-associated protein n=1 Tax=Streptomyces cyanogenus TaxID=80860 RepID=A0ABX7TTT2_STRCY|nr:CRISPR-associated protein [Streptomyces cyanogenus]